MQATEIWSVEVKTDETTHDSGNDTWTERKIFLGPRKELLKDVAAECVTHELQHDNDNMTLSRITSADDDNDNESVCGRRQ